MSDQATPVEPDEAATDATAAAESAIDWQKRYEDLRPQYDRVQNEASRLQDPGYRQQLFQELASENGYQLEDAAPEEVYDDPYQQMQARMDAYEQKFEQYTTAQQHQQQVAIAEAYAENQLDELGIPDGKEHKTKRDWIISRATSMPAIQYEGHVVPDVQAAYQEYTELVKAEQQAWAQSKQAPHVSAAGRENTGVPAWSDDPRERAEQRQQHMLEQISLREQ